MVKLVDTLDLGSSARAWGFESLQGHQDVPCSNGYSDPEDEKWCSNHGWFQSNRTGAGNARTVPVGKRVEGVCEGFETGDTIITAGGRRAICGVRKMVLP